MTGHYFPKSLSTYFCKSILNASTPSPTKPSGDWKATRLLLPNGDVKVSMYRSISDILLIASHIEPHPIEVEFNLDRIADENILYSLKLFSQDYAIPTPSTNGDPFSFSFPSLFLFEQYVMNYLSTD